MVRQDHAVQAMRAVLLMKLHVAPDSISGSLPRINPAWFNREFNDEFSPASIFPDICWLKTISGAWCSSVRLYSVMYRPCICGCIDFKDELVHYLFCAVLWQLARESMHAQEPSFQLDHRLCLCDPSVRKLKLRVLCHSLYHTSVNDTVCMNGAGFPNSAQRVQPSESDLARHCLQLVSGVILPFALM